MIWSFMSIIFSTWLSTEASYKGPLWQKWIFHFITQILLITLAFQAPNLQSAGYLIILGLISTLFGDFLIMLSDNKFLYAIGSFFLCRVLYTISFATHMTLTIFWPLPLTLIIIATIVILIIWFKLKELKWPICTYLASTILMIWVVGEQYFLLKNNYNLSLLIGTFLLLLVTSIWLISHYYNFFYYSRAIISSCYFIGNFFIVRSLYL